MLYLNKFIDQCAILCLADNQLPLTLLARNVRDVTGPCIEVDELDKTRKQLRASASKHNITTYESCLARAQVKVLAAHTRLSKEIKEWELQKVKEVGQEPWAEELQRNSTMHDKFKSLKKAESLLKHWKISVHL